jgi:hypothetical protein
MVHFGRTDNLNGSPLLHMSEFLQRIPFSDIEKAANRKPIEMSVQ